jgi:hypothetical protein
MPLAAASFLKSLSQASKLPEPHDAAKADVPDQVKTALMATACKERRTFICVRKPNCYSSIPPSRGDVGINRGQNKARQAERKLQSRRRTNQKELSVT